METSKKIEKLVRNAAKKDSSAWEELYRLTFKSAYFTAVKIAGSEQDAVDLVHDAYICAFEKIDQLAELTKFQSWLNTVVANKCRDYLRKKKPFLFTELQDGNTIEQEWIDDREHTRPELVLDRKETSRLISEIVSSLPEDQMLCVSMYYRDDLSILQIAEALEVSEGTVKSRLNYARKKIYARVMELEKQGTKLYGLAPLPLVIWLLKNEAATATAPPAAMFAPAIPSSVFAVQVTGVAASTATIGVFAKVVAGVLALSVAIGAVAVCSTMQNHETPPHQTQPSKTVQSNNSAQEAYALYEALLSQGYTDSGLEIAYYEYLDLDQDGVPELLTADYDGTPSSWTTCEVYTYHDKELHLCGTTSSNYDYLYLVNDTYLLGCHRKGHQYISTTEVIKTYLYFWNEDHTRNDPAIEHADGTLEYISSEQFDYYNAMPNESSPTNRFIQTADPIALKKNTFFRPNRLEGILDFSKAWSILMEYEGYMYHSCFVFENPETLYYVLSYASSEQPTHPFKLCKGTYSLKENTLILNFSDSWPDTAKHEDSIVYSLDPKTLTLTQVSENGLFLNHSKGFSFQLSEDQWCDAERVKGFFDEP